MKNKVTVILLSFLCLLTAGSIALSGSVLYSQKKSEKLIERYIVGEPDDGREDGVLIAHQYEIRSTLPISDAYKSGDTSGLSDRDRETLDMAKAVLDECIQDGMSDYEKEKAVYEYLASKLTASTGILTVVNSGKGEYDNPHDVLKNHSAVCAGYATTFRLFLQMMGIECKVIHSAERGHSWNLVRLDDGWYHTDCYMDSTDGGPPSYLHFNMDDTMASIEHEWTREYFPAAEGIKYNYIMSICEEIGSIYDIPDWFFGHITQDDRSFSCRFTEKIADEQTEKAASILSDRLKDLGKNDGSNIIRRWLTDSNGDYVLHYWVKKPASEISDETLQRIDDAIENAMEKHEFTPAEQPNGGSIVGSG